MIDSYVYISDLKKLESILLEIDEINYQINRVKSTMNTPRGANQALKIFGEVLDSYERNKLEILYNIKYPGRNIENDFRYNYEETKLVLIDELNKYQKEIMPVLIKKLHPNK